jgi:hypothetical protein
MMMFLIGFDDCVLDVPCIGPLDRAGQTQVICFEGTGIVFDEEAGWDGFR